MEGRILPFPKKGDLGITQNYRGITLTAIAAKTYNSTLRNRIQPEIENVLRRNQNGFRKNRSTGSQILTVRRIIEGVRAQNLQAVLFISQRHFTSQRKDGTNTTCVLPKETVDAIMMAKVRSPDGDTDFSDILAGNTLAPFLFVVCLDYVLRTSVDKVSNFGLTLTKARGCCYPATTITDADYADDLALISDTIAEAEALLHILERAAGDVGLHVNAGKMEFMCFNQEGTMKTVAGKPLKLVDTFTYLGSNIASTEKDVNIRIGKAWGALDGSHIIWKSNIPDEMKHEFFRAIVESAHMYGSNAWTLTKRLESKLDGTYTRMLRAALNIS